ncbi:MAG: adenylate/guanylate cyclase domain-containing protein, partial [Lachnospiraceae bacterium]|nr:adenylate/guanylate cyclase domain-containing protein [Lachnospiraceae bacterium]
MRYLSKMITAAVTAAVILTSLVFLYFGTAGFWDMGISDRLNQRESVTNKKIYIIGIDDKTLDEYGPVNTWSREVPAKLVSLLNSAGDMRPAVIGFDVIYSEEADQEADDKFADVCGEAGNVVAAMSFSFKEQPEKGADGRIVYNPYHVDHVIEPYDSLKDEVIRGFANTFVDTDGYVRQAMAYLDYEGEREYSLSSQVYKVYQESRGKEAVFPTVYGRNNRFYFTYSGKAGGYSVVSMADVLDGTVDPAIFQDAVVLVGAYAVGMQDSYMPAIAHNSQMYGVEIHANIIEALLEGKTQLPIPPLMYALAAALLCGIFYVCSEKMRMLYSTILLAVLAVLDLVFATVMYRNGRIVPTVLFPLCLLVIYLVQMVRRYLTEIMRRRRVINVFKQYVAPQVVDKISKDKDFELVIGGENRHIAVLFVDIRGFTTMSESLKPEEVVEILNEYLGLTTQAIFDHGGTLDKFVGDATMAVFNAPFDLDDYIYRAVATAWEMQAGADRIAEQFNKRFGKS